MKKKITLILMSVFLFSILLAQGDSRIRLSSETIKELVLKNHSENYLFYPIGSSQDSVIFIYEDLEKHSKRIYTIEESEGIIIRDYLSKVDFAKYSTNYSFKNKILFYSCFFSEPIEINGFSKMYLNYELNTYYIDSISNSDKKIHSSFSSDGKYLLVNTLNTLSDYYNPVQDNRIMVYDLKDIDNGEVKKQYIPCTHCSDSYLVGDQLFFTIGRKDGYGGFSNKDIYVAPWGSLKDSVKIANNTDILAISPDGKYILGTRFWDRQKTTAVIVDVEHKKYQMLLGRDYAERKTFYSYYENKFAFDFKGYLIYVDFPESYPFDALQWRNEEIPDWTEKEFWSQFQHPPLDK